MRKFLCRPFRDFEVDLDDPKTYAHLPKTTSKLDDRMLQKIGYTYCYMNFWHKKDYDEWDVCIEQKSRIELLIKNFTENRKHNYNNVNWYREQVFLFEDEIENMC